MQRITGRTNPTVVHFKNLGKSKSYRDTTGEFLCEGMKLLEDAVTSNIEITAVMTASDISIPLEPYTKVYYTTRSVIESISPQKNPQDTLFTCKKPVNRENISFNRGLHILLENLQDPGNVGTIIRTANAFGVQSVILTGQCADPYNPKTVRGTMGAIFRQSIIEMSIIELDRLKSDGIGFVAAVLADDAMQVIEMDLQNCIVAIGNESKGLSKALLDICDKSVIIPITSQSESLNAAVAAAIIMWESVRKG